MPGVPPDPTKYVMDMLADYDRRLRSLETQQAFIVTDGTLAERVKIGTIDGHDSGIRLTDALGNKQVLLPIVSQYVAATKSTTSGSPVVLAGAPSVTVHISNSGECQLTAGAFVGCSAGGSAQAYIVLDGDTAHPYSIFGLQGTAAFAANVQSTREWSTWIGALTPGAHTFSMMYSATGGTGNFSANFLAVQPL